MGTGKEGGKGERRQRRDVLNTIISRINTMKPSTPPLVPYFQVLSTVVAASSSAMAKETKRRLKKSEEIIVTVPFFPFQVIENWYYEVRL
jgi:hypothetical protein